GDPIHGTVLPMFVEANADLFVEVAIPGSTREFVDPKKAGVADLYKAEPARTIGLRFDEGPAFLTKNNKLRFGGRVYDHNRLSAPQGGKHKPRARRMNFAPH